MRQLCCTIHTHLPRYFSTTATGQQILNRGAEVGSTLPAIQYIPCLSITAVFEGPAATLAPMVITFGPANWKCC